jgi:hypothetical protein
MDLFHEYREHAGKLSVAAFMEERRRYIFRALERARANPAVASRQDDLERIGDDIHARSDKKQLWRDDEILHRLSMLQSRHERPETHLISLDLLLGNIDIQQVAEELPPGAYRHHHQEGRIYQVRDGGLEDMTETAIFLLPGFEPIILMPTDGLFDVQIYPRCAPVADQAEVRRKTTEAVELLRAYSPTLYDAFTAVISTMALLPESSRSWSGNFGFQHYGAIFANPFPVNLYIFVEGWIHEYFHHNSWLYWDVIEPVGVPPESVCVESPVSQRQVPAHSMLDALFIYINHLDYYSWVAASPMKIEQHRSFVEEKVRDLSWQIPLLQERLCEVVPTHTTMRDFIDFGAGRFHDILRKYGRKYGRKYERDG